jgi:hypothetical protein
MDINQEKLEVACLERSDVGISVKSVEFLSNARQFDIPGIGRWDCYLTHLFTQAHFAAVVQECQAFIISGLIGKGKFERWS